MILVPTSEDSRIGLPMRFSRGELGYWTALIGAALVLRAIVALGLLGAMPLVGDARAYADQAIALGTSFPGGAPFAWPPGMSFLLAAASWALGPDVAVARATTVVLGVLVVIFTALLAGRVLADPRAAKMAGWIAALYPPAILLSGQPYSQHLAQLCLVATTYLLVAGFQLRSGFRFGLAGTMLGLAALARPSALSVALLLLLLWGVALLRNQERACYSRRLLARWGAAACTGTFALTLPVMAHHASLGEGWVLSTNNEWNFFAGNNRFTPNYKTSHLAQRDLDELPPETRDYLVSFRTRPDARQAMMAEATRFVRANPGLTALRVVNRARAFWGFDYLASRLIQKEYGLGEAALGGLLFLEAGGYLAVMLLALLSGLCARERIRTNASSLLIALTGAYAIPYLVAFAHGTYHFPVIPLIIPFAAASLATLIEQPGPTTRDLLTRPSTWLVTAAFAAIQLEYAWHAAILR